jgi:hypothetical protein
MKKCWIALCFITLFALPLCSENYLRFTINATLIVYDPEGAEEKIIAWLKANKGFFIVKSAELLSVRFPSERLAEFTRLLEGLGDEVKEFKQESADAREELLALSSGIKSREEMLTKNSALFERANVKDTLEIEKELVLLVKEIEELKGRLKKLENDRKNVSAIINFSFKKSPVPEKKPSSFAWINTLDFYKLKQEGFPHE